MVSTTLSTYAAPPPVKLLVVDDLKENLIALEALLRREGIEVLGARSGRDALEMLLVEDVALALVDVQMPEMDGFELAELMRGTERTRHVPIILLTAGQNDKRRLFRGYEAGAVDFLFKPIDSVLLGHKVATFVELHRRRVECHEMLRLNEMFLAAVGHDLRSPLSTVITGTGVIEHQVDDPRALRTIGRVRASAKRMLDLLDQLNDLARARLGGGFALERGSTDVRALTTRVLEEFALSNPERAVTLDVNARSTTGDWDERRLEQVVSNLVGNAIRHGKPESEVRVTVHGEPSALRIEVHNQGEIPSDIRPHLFDPFRHGTRTTRSGLGLGLYIVRQIVEAHGGEVDVSSSPEAGTTFRVTLPRAHGSA